MWAALPEARDSGDTDAERSPKAWSAVCIMHQCEKRNGFAEACSPQPYFKGVRLTAGPGANTREGGRPKRSRIAVGAMEPSCAQRRHGCHAEAMLGACWLPSQDERAKTSKMLRGTTLWSCGAMSRPSWDQDLLGVLGPCWVILGHLGSMLALCLVRTRSAWKQLQSLFVKLELGGSGLFISLESCVLLRF